MRQRSVSIGGSVVCHAWIYLASRRARRIIVRRNAFSMPLVTQSLTILALFPFQEVHALSSHNTEKKIRSKSAVDNCMQHPDLRINYILRKPPDLDAPSSDVEIPPH